MSVFEWGRGDWVQVTIKAEVIDPPDPIFGTVRLAIPKSGDQVAATNLLLPTRSTHVTFAGAVRPIELHPLGTFVRHKGTPDAPVQLVTKAGLADVGTGDVHPFNSDWVTTLDYDRVDVSEAPF
jgi:hypothetical protein